MGKNISKIFFSLASAVMVSMFVCSGAFAATTGLTVTQTASTLTDSVTKQEYHVSYMSESVQDYVNGTALVMECGEGFVADSLYTGHWSDCGDGLALKVDQGQESGGVINLTAGQDELVDLSSIDHIVSIEVTPQDASSNRNVTGLILSGDVYADSVGNELKFTSRYYGCPDGDRELLGEASTTMECNAYEVGTPELSADKSSVDYLGGINVNVRNISGKSILNPCEKYTVDINIPQRMFIDKVSMPGFENAEYDLYVNGVKRIVDSDTVYINARVSDFSLNIVPDSEEFTQTKDMVIEMRNAVNDASTEVFSASAEAQIGSEFKETAKSNEVSIKFNNVVIERPSTPPAPETPSGGESEANPAPSTPSNPSKPAGTQKPSSGTTGGSSQTGVSGNTTPSVPEKDMTIVDFTGMDIHSAKATSDSTNTLLNFYSSGNSNGNGLLNSGSRNKVQTVQIFDYTEDDSGMPESTSEALANAADGQDGSVSSGSGSGRSAVPSTISNTPFEQQTEKVSQTFIGNRMLQLVTMIVAVILLALLGLLIIVKKGQPVKQKVEDMVDSGIMEDSDFIPQMSSGWDDDDSIKMIDLSQDHTGLDRSLFKDL